MNEDLYGCEQRLASTEQQLEKIQEACASLIIANHALEDRAVLLLGGLIEIEKIKGSPPIQVSRTIATRTIKACQSNEMLTPEDVPVNAPAGPAQVPAQHEAGDVPGRADQSGGAGKEGSPTVNP